MALQMLCRDGSQPTAQQPQIGSWPQMCMAPWRPSVVHMTPMRVVHPWARIHWCLTSGQQQMMPAPIPGLVGGFGQILPSPCWTGFFNMPAAATHPVLRQPLALAWQQASFWRHLKGLWPFSPKALRYMPHPITFHPHTSHQGGSRNSVCSWGLPSGTCWPFTCRLHNAGRPCGEAAMAARRWQRHCSFACCAARPSAPTAVAAGRWRQPAWSCAQLAPPNSGLAPSQAHRTCSWRGKVNDCTSWRAPMEASWATLRQPPPWRHTAVAWTSTCNLLTASTLSQRYQPHQT